MDEKTLKEILEQHKLWLESEGDEGIGADLRGANLRGAKLFRADLRGANLCMADLSEANLSKADLRGANLCIANLCMADLSEADLSGVTGVPFIPMTCPDSGSFIGWKKAGDHIVKLLIPEDARRSSAIGRKCRTDKAVVLAIESIDGSTSELKEVCSTYDSCFMYRIGETAIINNFDEDRFNECAPGIHFFINRQEAVDY